MLNVCSHGSKQAPVPVNLRGGFETRPYNVTGVRPATLTALPVGFALFGEGPGAFLAVFGGEQLVVHVVGEG